MLYDLAARLEYVKPLREEIIKAWKIADGHPDRSTVLRLEKLDSFMKESQRLNPPGMGLFESALNLVFFPLTDDSVLYSQGNAAHPSLQW